MVFFFSFFYLLIRLVVFFIHFMRFADPNVFYACISSLCWYILVLCWLLVCCLCKAHWIELVWNANKKIKKWHVFTNIFLNWYIHIACIAGWIHRKWYKFHRTPFLLKSALRHCWCNISQFSMNWWSQDSRLLFHCFGNESTTRGM